MPESNPFTDPNRKPRPNDGVLDIDKIIEEEKIHSHNNAVAEQAPAPVETAMINAEPVSPPVEPETSNLDLDQVIVKDTRPPAEPEAEPEPEEEEIDQRYDDDTDIEEPAADNSTWRPSARRIPRVERVAEESPEDTTESLGSEPTDDIILGPPKNTPNRRNLLLVMGAALVIITLVFLIPRLINDGILFKTTDTGTTGKPNGDSSNVTAGLSKDVTLKKVSDGLESDDPDNWEATFTVDTTTITLDLDCTAKPGGGTSPNLDCVAAGGAGEVVDGTFVKPFTAGEGWKYVDKYYGYCYSFADKVSKNTVQADLYGSSGIQRFYMGDDFQICSKTAGNPDDTPKGTPCDNEQAYCPAVRLRSIR